LKEITSKYSKKHSIMIVHSAHSVATKRMLFHAEYIVFPRSFCTTLMTMTNTMIFQHKCSVTYRGCADFQHAYLKSPTLGDVCTVQCTKLPETADFILPPRPLGESLSGKKSDKSRRIYKFVHHIGAQKHLKTRF